MDKINFALSVAGFVLGLISVWPKLSAWATSAKNVYSERGRRAAENRSLQLELAANDPSYLISYLMLNIVGSILLFAFVYLLKKINTEGELATISAIVRLVASAISGGLIGNIIGMSFVVVHRKQKSAKNGS